MEEAKKYTSIKDFKEHEETAYRYCRINDWIEENASECGWEDIS